MSEAPAVRPAADSRRALVFELAAVLLLFLVPETWAALTSLWRTPSSSSGAPGTIIVYAVSRIFPLLYVMYVSGRPWQHFGIRRPTWNDIYWVLPVLAGMLAVDQLLRSGWLWLHLPVGTAASHAHLARRLALRQESPFLLVLTVLITATSEELSMRSYLVTRLREWIDSPTVAVWVAAVPFAIYHLYQGPFGVLNAYLLGAVLGFAFTRQRSVFTVILAHSLFNTFLYFTSTYPAR